MASLLIAGALASAGKQIVGRTRPPAALRLVNETNPSFPSGHATDAAAVFLTIGLVIAVFVLRRPIARACSVAAGALLGVAVALSRLVLGVHWPTDVIAGWAIGTVVALTITVTAALATHLTPRLLPRTHTERAA
jgi:undecaprenyl-diphosphatase